MSKYRFKTEEEFSKDGTWNISQECPEGWSWSGEMNEYLGTDVPVQFNHFIDSSASLDSSVVSSKIFHLNGWSFNISNCILKVPVFKFKEREIVKVIKTNASEEDWKHIGKISVDFNVGDILTVLSCTNYSVKFNICGNWYPISMFEKYDKTIKEYTVKDFTEGQSVRVITTEASSVHWAAVGKIKFPYNIGEILTIERIGAGLIFTTSKGYSYPACMFEPVNDVVVDKKKISDLDLLAEAKRRYPIGTKFIPAHISRDDTFCIITNENFEKNGDNIISFTDDFLKYTHGSNSRYGNCSYNRLVYDNGNWATIIPPDIPIPLIIPEQFLHQELENQKNVGKYIFSIANDVKKLPFGSYYLITKEDTGFLYCEELCGITKARLKDKEIVILDTLQDCQEYLKEELSTNPCSEIPLTPNESYLTYLDDDKSYTTKKREIVFIKTPIVKSRLKF